MAPQHIFARDSGGSLAMAQPLNTGTLVGICVGSAALLAFLVGFAIAFAKLRSRHRRLLDDIEQRGLEVGRASMSNVLTTVPHHVLRPSTFVPFGTQSGWNTLNSQEDVSNATMPNRLAPGEDLRREMRRSSTRMAWPFSRRASAFVEVPLDAVDNTRLSAIVESHAVGRIQQPGSEDHEFQIPLGNNALLDPSNFPLPPSNGISSSPFITNHQGEGDSLKPAPLSVTKNRKKRNRAQTISTTVHPMPRKTEMEEPVDRRNVYSHSRSFSLGSQNPGIVPMAPVPPLPLSVVMLKGASRPQSWDEINSSGLSVSSIESIGSSLIAASPRVTRRSSARMKNGPKQGCASSLIVGPRSPRKNTLTGVRPHSAKSSPEHAILHSLRGSIKSNTDRLSVESYDSKVLGRSESTNVVSDVIDTSPVSKIATAETIRLSRASVVSTGGVNKAVQSPFAKTKRQSRLMVTPNGSPAHRRTSYLREICGNQSGSTIGPTRQPSHTSSRASSTRSSNGNPFQWDPSPMASGKPSAMKGSPNSRNKGHKRSNCVRIQLSPQILGAASKSPSPSIMADIQEESPEACSKDPPTPTGHSRALPRPPSSSTFAPDLKLNNNLTTLRASLTQSSPTLLILPLERESSSRELSISSFNSSPLVGGGKRQSTTSSIFQIPSFPSPGKTVLTTNVMPTPTFSFSRPSNEFDEGRSPPAEFRRLAKPVAPDSPPADILLQSGDQVDLLSLPESPVHRLNFIDEPKQNDEEDPEDVYPSPDPTPRPLFEPHSWTAPPGYKEHLEPISPPCSPKSMSPSPAPAFNFDFNSSPPVSEDLPFILENDATIPERSQSPIPALPHQPKTSVTNLHGPRECPPKNLGSSIAKLRRMNSDAQTDSSLPGLRSAKRYLRLGRRADSPVLDQTGSRCGSWVSISAAMGVGAARSSMTSLCEIDRALEGSLEGLEELDEEDEGMEALSLGGDKHVASEDSATLQELSAIDELPNTERLKQGKRNKRESSVWEDGEQYWKKHERIPNEDLDVPRPLATTTNTQNKNDGGEKVLLPQRVSQMRKSAIFEKMPAAVSGIGTPEVKVQPPSSDRGTPGSLYDENGFLMS